MWQESNADKTSSRNRQASRTVKEKIQSSSQANQSLKLPNKLKSEKTVNQSCTDRHHEIKQNIGVGPSVLPKSSGNHHKQWVERKSNKEGELVKYMSNLPCYLKRVDRGENLQEKALNFGVLDWGRLEEWKYTQKQIPGSSSMYSSSGSNTSSMIGSSTLSGSINSGTIAHQKERCPSLHSHMTSSSKESHSHCVKHSRGKASAFQDLKTVPSKASSVSQKKLPRTDQSFGRNYSEIELEKVEGNDSDPKIIPEMGKSSHFKDHEFSLCPKGKMKAGEVESIKITEHFKEFRLHDQHFPGRSKTIVLLLPRDFNEKSFSGNSQPPDSIKIDDGKSTEANCTSFSDSFYVNDEVQFTELCSDIPLHSYPLPNKDEISKESDVKLCSSIDARGAEFDVSNSLPCSDVVRTKDEQTEADNSIIKSTKLTVIKPSTKGEYPSPNHLSTVGLGLMSRSFSFKEVSSVPQLKSTYVTAKSGPVGPDASCVDNSNGDKTNSNSRARSSPLRRLLDPLLKPKTSNRLQSTEPLPDESTSRHRTCKSYDGQLDLPCVARPVKRNLSFLSCNSTNTDVSHQDEKQVALMVQAILEVTVKDGLPLLTFAVNNNDNILAATMKKISTSGKYDCSWVYTFFSFQKIKKKSVGWINHGSKGKRIDYIPKVVGELKVSGSQCSNTRHNSKDQFMAREFVLSSVEQKQVGQEIRNPQPSSELAAVVVKVPKETMGSVCTDGWPGSDCKKSSEMGPPTVVPEESCCCSSEEHLQSGSLVESQSLSSIIAILPGAVHSLPATGVPSSLINRWRSGGSCDCGGWDEGCSLRILASRDQRNKKSSSHKDFCAEDQIELFIQGGATQENRTVFSLSTFKEGIYSIDFDSSISLLQAFSISTAILDCRKLAELSEVSNLLEDIISEEFLSMENDRIKIPTQVEVEAPPTYVPYPPLSPVGRV